MTGSDSSGASTKFNDNQWHSVSFLVSKTSILLVVDDFESSRIDITDSDQSLLLETHYSIYLAGVPEETIVPSGAVS